MQSVSQAYKARHMHGRRKGQIEEPLRKDVGALIEQIESR